MVKRPHFSQMGLYGAYSGFASLPVTSWRIWMICSLFLNVMSMYGANAPLS